MQAGIGGRRRHLADQESAIAAAQRRRCKDVIDARVRKTPIAPRAEAGVIGLEARAAQHAAFDRVALQQQDAAVPNARNACAAGRRNKPSISVAPLGGERPRPRLKADLRPIERGDLGVRRARRRHSGLRRSTARYLCHGLTNNPMRPVTPFICGDGGVPNLAVNSSRVRPDGSSPGAKSVAISVNV